MWSQRVAASCVWLAGKLEESPRKSKHIIFVFHRMECRRENLPIEYLDVFSKVYFVQLNIILISFLLKPPCTFRLDIYGINLESLFFFSFSFFLTLLRYLIMNFEKFIEKLLSPISFRVSPNPFPLKHTINLLGNVCFWASHYSMELSSVCEQQFQFHNLWECISILLWTKLLSSSCCNPY